MLNSSSQTKTPLKEFMNSAIRAVCFR